MKMIFTPAVAAAVLALSACGGQGDDTLGDNAADAAEMQAENFEEMADNATNEVVEENLEDRADAIEEQGEETEEAIDDADVNAAGNTSY